jgi:tRNA (guanosine-2'-O-)-methyltransferase
MPLSPIEYRLTEHFAKYISEHKKEFVERVLRDRTRFITVVLEDIYQSQNASAAVRTCECFGVQDIHIIENTAKYEVNRGVLKGSYKWESLIRHRSPERNNTEMCYHQLRTNGYTIYATDPGAENIAIGEIDVYSGKAALVFGNEHLGLSAYALEQADHKVRIPMHGFTESLNISVSVAVCLATTMPRLRTNWDHCKLTPDEMDELRLTWYRKIVKRSDIIEKQFLNANR